MKHSDDIVYVPARTRLGDTIIAVNNAIALSKQLGKKIRFALNPKLKTWTKENDYNSVQSCIQRLEAAFFLLKHENHLELCDYSKIEDWIELPKLPINSLIENAKSNNAAKINFACYDFFPATPRNRFSFKQRKEIVNYLTKKKIPLINCHDAANQFGLIKAIELMASCEHFIGADSGMSHIAHVLNLKVHIIRQGSSPEHVAKWHAGCSYFLYDNVYDFIDRF